MVAAKTPSTPIQATKNLTFEKFIQKYMDVLAELVDGKIKIVTPASNRHQDLIEWISSIWQLFFGCRPSVGINLMHGRQK